MEHPAIERRLALEIVKRVNAGFYAIREALQAPGHMDLPFIAAMIANTRRTIEDAIGPKDFGVRPGGTGISRESMLLTVDQKYWELANFILETQALPASDDPKAEAPGAHRLLCASAIDLDILLANETVSEAVLAYEARHA